MPLASALCIFISIFMKRMYKHLCVLFLTIKLCEKQLKSMKYENIPTYTCTSINANPPTALVFHFNTDTSLFAINYFCWTNKRRKNKFPVYVSIYIASNEIDLLNAS